MFKGSLDTIEAFNSAITSGRYLYNGNISSSILGTSVFGVVEVLSAESYISQIIYGSDRIAFRLSFNNGVGWSSWESIGG